MFEWDFTLTSDRLGTGAGRDGREFGAGFGDALLGQADGLACAALAARLVASAALGGDVGARSVRRRVRQVAVRGGQAGFPGSDGLYEVAVAACRVGFDKGECLVEFALVAANAGYIVLLQ